MSEQKTHAEIIDWMRKSYTGPQELADMLEAAHKREVDALKQRCAELDAEVAAKDEVIKRLNDAIAEEQRRKMTTTEKLSAVGDCAKLREALVQFIGDCKNLDQDLEEQVDGHYSLIPKYLDIMHDFRDRIKDAEAALAAPPRNCDALTADERTHKFIEKWEKAHGESIDGKTIIYLSSFSRWTQLPYESEVGK